MKESDHIELVLLRMLAIKATGRLAILATALIVTFLIALMFAYALLR